MYQKIKKISRRFCLNFGDPKHPNIKTIIIQIYTFLSFISDLHIIILDKNYYLDQIEIKERIKDIFRWFSRRFCLNFGDPNDFSNITYPKYKYVKKPKNKNKSKKKI